MIQTHYWRTLIQSLLFFRSLQLIFNQPRLVSRKMLVMVSFSLTLWSLVHWWCPLCMSGSIVHYSGGSRGRPRHASPPPAAKFFSISCSSRRKKLNFIPVPPAPRVDAPPCENPGSATALLTVQWLSRRELFSDSHLSRRLSIHRNKTWNYHGIVIKFNTGQATTNTWLYVSCLTS